MCIRLEILSSGKNDIIEKVRNEVMLLNEQYISQAEDEYNFWEEHVKYVVKEAVDLALKYNADVEIVELSALLHDIALISKPGTRSEHHITGAKLAENMLAKFDYPNDKIDRVCQCVLNHRSSKNGTTIEELCVADADILAHFDNIPMIFSCTFRNTGITLPEVRSGLKESFEYDYNDLSDQTKAEFSDRYKLICQIVLGV